MIKNKTEQKIMVTGAKGYIGRNFINKYENKRLLKPMPAILVLLLNNSFLYLSKLFRHSQ
jgi:nucleoside-diphosphate-sugar epimerase